MATLRFNKHAKPVGTKFEIWGISGAQAAWMNLHRRGSGEGGRQRCSGQNRGVCDLLPTSPWHWSAAAGAGCWAQAASRPAAQSWDPAKTCRHWSEREGNTAGDTMVRGECGDTSHTGTGRTVGEGRQGDLPLLSVVCATKPWSHAPTTMREDGKGVSENPMGAVRHGEPKFSSESL